MRVHRHVALPLRLKQAQARRDARERGRQKFRAALGGLLGKDMMVTALIMTIIGLLVLWSGR